MPDSPTARRLLVTVGLVVVGLVVVLVAVLWIGLGTAGAAQRHAAVRLAAASDPAATSAADAELTPLKAAALGVIEGVTEFLPISSTGHLLISQRLMDVGTTDATKDAADTYAIVIQGGAILAVLVLYWRRVLEVLQGLVGRSESGRRLLVALVVAFLPAAVVGLVFEKRIKETLFGPWPVVAAWVVGGLALLWVSTKGWERKERIAPGLETITASQALVIGLAQILALWPGTSRSLVTIVAAVLVGLSLAAAVEFSFLLGLVTLGAATAFDLVKGGGDLFDAYGFVDPAIGFVAAFVAAVLAVRFLVSYVQRHSLAVFGWYRLAIAGVAVGLIATGRL